MIAFDGRGGATRVNTAYRVFYATHGRPTGAAGSFVVLFGDANRAAVARCGEYRVATEVHLVTHEPYSSVCVARYEPTATGRVVAVDVGAAAEVRS